MLAEPQATSADLLFDLSGIRVRVSAWFWLAAGLLGWNVCQSFALGDQRLLLQIIWANKTVLTHAVFKSLGDHFRGDNIFILRRQSSWANADTLVKFVRLLSQVSEPLAQHRHVVLTLDACPVHLSARVARARVPASSSILCQLT